MRIGFVGAGSWALTLGLLFSRRGYRVRLWEVSAPRAERAQRTRRVEEFLPGIELPPEMEVTVDLSRALEGAEVVVFAVPCQALRESAERVKEVGAKPQIMVSVIKGLENETLLRGSEVIEEILSPASLVVLSGPSIAYEVARGVPTTVVAASQDPETTRYIQGRFSIDNFRVYTSQDVIGVELGGALKNVIVIAAGICDGLGLGVNAKGALLSRGLREITRLGTAMGADPSTFAGLSGMGDLVATAFSPHSRNRWVGEELGRGKPLAQILSSMVMVAEGVPTTKAALELARQYEVEMPITQGVYEVCFKGASPKEELRKLMDRPLKPEMW